MNKRGITQVFTLMLAVVFILMALYLAGPTASVIQEARGAANLSYSGSQTGMDCDNSSISDFNKATCVSTDLMGPLFFGVLVGVAGILIGAKIILS